MTETAIDTLLKQARSELLEILERVHCHLQRLTNDNHPRTHDVLRNLLGFMSTDSDAVLKFELFKRVITG